MSSAVASPMRSSSNRLTSSTCVLLSLQSSRSVWLVAGLVSCAGRGSDLFDAARLTPGQVDAELLGRAEHVLVAVAHLDLHAVAGEHLDVEAQRLHLLDEDLERLGDARLGDVLALDDGLVHLDPAHDVVGL